MLAVLPALAAIAAFEHRGRSGAEDQLAGLRMLHQRPPFLICHAVVDLAPLVAAVLADEHAGAARRGVHAARLVDIDDDRRSDRALSLQTGRRRGVDAVFRRRAVNAVLGAYIKDASLTVLHNRSCRPARVCFSSAALRMPCASSSLTSSES